MLLWIETDFQPEPRASKCDSAEGLLKNVIFASGENYMEFLHDEAETKEK